MRSIQSFSLVQLCPEDTFETIARHGSCITYVAEFVESLHRHFAGYLILQLEGSGEKDGGSADNNRKTPKGFYVVLW